MKNRKRKRRKNKRDQQYLTGILFGLGLTAAVVLILNGVLFLRDIFGAKDTEMVSKTETVPVEIEIETKTETLPETEQESETKETKKLCVILDAGHGGNDGGTSSGDIIEKYITLDISEKMKPLLEEKGIEVIMTRVEDEYVALEERTQLANEAEGNLFFSLHCNYYEEGSSVAGLESYYYAEGNSKECAESIIETLKARGNISARNAKERDYYVLKFTHMPAVLIELGYLSNPTERNQLVTDSYQQLMAEELTEAIWNYLLDADAVMSGDAVE